METTLTWFDHLMITLTFAEEDASACLGDHKQLARTPDNHPRPRGLGHGLQTTKANA